jgi:hypothetical protein
MRLSRYLRERGAYSSFVRAGELITGAIRASSRSLDIMKHEDGLGRACFDVSCGVSLILWGITSEIFI